MAAFHNDEELKNRLLQKMNDTINRHALIHDDYWDNERKQGCAIGCIVMDEPRENWHEGYKKITGIPPWLSSLMERIFDLLPEEEDAKFALDFLQAIPPGSTYTGVADAFLLWLFTHNQGMQHLCESVQVMQVLQMTARFFKKIAAGETVNSLEIHELRNFIVNYTRNEHLSELDVCVVRSCYYAVSYKLTLSYDSIEYSALNASYVYEKRYGSESQLYEDYIFKMKEHLLRLLVESK